MRVLSVRVKDIHAITVFLSRFQIRGRAKARKLLEAIGEL